jgi:hypothetical protein
VFGKRRSILPVFNFGSGRCRTILPVACLRKGNLEHKFIHTYGRTNNFKRSIGMYTEPQESTIKYVLVRTLLEAKVSKSPSMFLLTCEIWKAEGGHRRKLCSGLDPVGASLLSSSNQSPPSTSTRRSRRVSAVAATALVLRRLVVC